MRTEENPYRGAMHDLCQTYIQPIHSEENRDASSSEPFPGKRQPEFSTAMAEVPGRLWMNFPNDRTGYFPCKKYARMRIKPDYFFPAHQEWGRRTGGSLKNTLHPCVLPVSVGIFGIGRRRRWGCRVGRFLHLQVLFGPFDVGEDMALHPGAQFTDDIQHLIDIGAGTIGVILPVSQRSFGAAQRIGGLLRRCQNRRHTTSSPEMGICPAHRRAVYTVHCRVFLHERLCILPDSTSVCRFLPKILIFFDSKRQSVLSASFLADRQIGKGEQEKPSYLRNERKGRIIERGHHAADDCN